MLLENNVRTGVAGSTFFIYAQFWKVRIHHPDGVTVRPAPEFSGGRRKHHTMLATIGGKGETEVAM